MDDGEWLSGVWNSDFARASAALIERSHCAAPVAGGLSQVMCGEIDPNQFFGFGEGGRSDFWANNRGCAESRWRSRWESSWLVLRQRGR